ncbi:MAG TPA: pyruvate dehydrogenase (acetyl-transferring) E1 component subunit alpha [Aeromonadales bacterium]|nr:pyruvate dehydrogenase (acetyl-transferring) E1 component subunit alpha [Aeromonadales bacterium]
MKKVATFEIDYLQYLDNEGVPISDELPSFAKDSDLLRQLYFDMNLLRAFDAKAYAMQRTGKMGTYPASLGQEAIGIGYGSVMKKEDVLVPYYRSTGGLLQHGVTMTEILTYWGGDERGSAFKNAPEDLPIAVPIATQCLNAAGVATAIKLRNQPRAVVTEIGEGGTSKGDFYEAINVAGIWKLGVLFVVNNNQWAISVPSEIQTATQTYAQKAIAAGIPCLQVDGNDILAVREASDIALKRARKGEGATLIEYISYRLCDHTTADDASRYRDDKEVKQAWKNEPILRLRKYLQSLDIWSEADEETMSLEITNQVNQAVEEFSKMPKPEPVEMIDYIYAELPEIYQDQREELLKGGA